MVPRIESTSKKIFLGFPRWGNVQHDSFLVEGGCLLRATTTITTTTTTRHNTKTKQNNSQFLTTRDYRY
jgi:hypothetical protein